MYGLSGVHFGAASVGRSIPVDPGESVQVILRLALPTSCGYSSPFHFARKNPIARASVIPRVQHSAGRHAFA